MVYVTCTGSMILFQEPIDQTSCNRVVEIFTLPFVILWLTYTNLSQTVWYVTVGSHLHTLIIRYDWQLCLRTHIYIYKVWTGTGNKGNNFSCAPSTTSLNPFLVARRLCKEMWPSNPTVRDFLVKLRLNFCEWNHHKTHQRILQSECSK
jgi:hypothetical protein